MIIASPSKCESHTTLIYSSFLFFCPIRADGNLATLDVSYHKMLARFEEINLPSTRAFVENWELMVSIYNANPILIMVDQHQSSHMLLKAIGFSWGKEGFQFFDEYFAEFVAAFPFFEHKCESLFCRLMIFLSSPDGAIDEAEVNAWIPLPAEIAKIERGNIVSRRLYTRAFRL